MDATAKSIAGVALATIVLLGLAIGSIRPAEMEKVDPQVEWPSMRLCVTDVLKDAAASGGPVPGFKEASDLCYTHLRAQGLINDFRFRRLKFVQQTYDERILLWMVVAVTLSGVALAAVQLLASFRLAQAGNGTAGQAVQQQTEMSIERGKLSVKSSITGLLILICSFAFFWVFVYEIYVIRVVDVDGERSESPPRNEQKAPGILQPRAPATVPAAVSSAPAGATPGRNK